MGEQDFTIDFWVRLSSIPQNNCLLAANQLEIKMNTVTGSRFFCTIMGSSFAITPTLTTDTWYHVAVVRQGDMLYGYTNGELYNDRDFSGNIDLSGVYVKIGASGYSLNGWLDEFRISVGIARWTANFTPPTKEY